MAIILPPPPPPDTTFGAFAYEEWFIRVFNLVIDEIQNAIDELAADLEASLDHNDLQNIQGGSASERYHLTSAQHTTLTGLGTIASSTWTPTIVNGTNVSASTWRIGRYIRIGSIVVGNGTLDITTSAAGTSDLTITMPLVPTNNFAITFDVGGLMSCDDGGDGQTGGEVVATTSAKTATLNFEAASGPTLHRWQIQFMYTFS